MFQAVVKLVISVRAEQQRDWAPLSVGHLWPLSHGTWICIFRRLCCINVHGGETTIIKMFSHRRFQGWKSISLNTTRSFCIVFQPYGRFDFDTVRKRDGVKLNLELLLSFRYKYCRVCIHISLAFEQMVQAQSFFLLKESYQILFMMLCCCRKDQCCIQAYFLLLLLYCPDDVKRSV